MRRVGLALVALTAWPLPARSEPLDRDSRIEIVQWHEDSETQLRTTAGGSVVVLMAPGEMIRSVLVGDPGAVEVRVAPQADSLTIAALRQPGDPNVTVQTHLRRYRFRLVLGPPNDVTYAVRFRYAAPAVNQPGETIPPATASNSYGIKGQPGLQPVRVSDDGQKTYIEWGNDQPLPAVFAINALGEEETVDNYMRQGVMVIDRVYPQLVFRIGKSSAQARRLGLAKEAKQ